MKLRNKGKIMGNKTKHLTCPVCDDVLGTLAMPSEDPDCAYILEGSCVECAVLVHAYTPTKEYFQKYHDQIARRVLGDNTGSQARH